MFRKKTGLPIDAYFSATKIEWILKNVPGAMNKAKKGRLCFGTTDIWILWKITGGLVHSTDYTNASRTMLFNIEKKEWDNELIKIFKIPKSMLPKVKKLLSDLKDKKIAIWGLAFKPKTDDIREAPSITLIKQLLGEEAKIVAFDPEAMDNFKQLFPKIIYCKTSDEVLNSEAVLITTRWDEFKRLDYNEKIVIDGRKLDEYKTARIYEGVGW